MLESVHQKLSHTTPRLLMIVEMIRIQLKILTQTQGHILRKQL